MTLPELSCRLDELGVLLSVRLVVDAPRGVLTPEITDALKDHKPLLLVWLSREAQWEALRHLRWGPAIDDPTPGIIAPAPAPRTRDRERI